METLLNALPWIVGGLILILLLAALRRPLNALLRLALRTGAGLFHLSRRNNSRQQIFERSQ